MPKPCSHCRCSCGSFPAGRIAELEDCVRSLRKALRAAEPSLDDDADPGPFRRFVRATDAALSASLKVVEDER